MTTSTEPTGQPPTDAPDVAAGTDATGGAGPVEVATNAFLAGFPLVTTMRIAQTFAQVAGVNRLVSRPRLAGPESRVVVAPNRDTVYAVAVLDLRAGPQVLTVPEIRDGRYYVIQLLDAWMGGFGLVGTRPTGGRAGSWAIVPAGYDGPIPAGAERLDCPTSHAVVLGRIRAVDDEDAVAAGAVAAQMRLEPLATSQTTEPAASAGRRPGRPEASVPADGRGSAGGAAGDLALTLPAPAGRPQEVGANGLGFFDELGDALAANPPVTGEQRAALAAAESLGVGAGRRPGDDPDGPHAEVLLQGVAGGLRALGDRDGSGVRSVNGWQVNLGLGTADTDQGLRRRATVARYFWGPVPAEEAVYPLATTGSDGEPLDGTRRYRIHFPPGGLPPVGAFWSLTVYGPDMFLVPNPAHRYSLSGDTAGLVTNPDGSLDIHLQHDVPEGAEGREANWLPVPAGGRFSVMMRLYLPGAAVLDGSYAYPPITPVS